MINAAEVLNAAVTAMALANEYALKVEVFS
jgi:hypothetical protein